MSTSDARPSPARMFPVLAVIFGAGKVVLLALFAWNSLFVMDELVQTEMSIRIPEGFYSTIDPIKTVLYVYYFGLARGVAGDAVELMHVARLLGLALALGMVALVYGTVRNLGRDRHEALFAGCLLLSFSTFMERSFRVRSDTLAVFLAVAALWVATRLAGRRWWAPAAAGLLAGGAFLSTQKAVYFVAALGLAYLVVGVVEQRRWRGIVPAALFGGGWAASLLVYSAAFGGWGFHRVLGMIFLSPARYAWSWDRYYDNLGRFVFQTLELNQLAYALGFSGVAVALAGWRRLDAAGRLALVATLVILPLVFFHNQPWPYVFVMALPPLALWGGETVRLLAGSEGRRDAVALVLLAMLAVSWARNVSYLSLDNALQSQVMHQAEALLGPGDRYADGLGMIPSRRRAGIAWWWDTRSLAEILQAASRGDFTALDDTFADQPKVWIYNYRIDALRRLLAPRLERGYVRVHPNVFLAGTAVTPGEEVRFLNPWEGRYRLYGADGRPRDSVLIVDGAETRGPLSLGLGEHPLTLPPGNGEERLFLLPESVDLPGRLPAEGPPLKLFGGVYD